jgi:hypothetical protein
MLVFVQNAKNHGEWEAGISPYIYCSNDEVLQVDSDGKEYLGDCDFTEDDVYG